MPDAAAVSVADLIHQLRGDLYRAAWQGDGKDPKFVVGPVELELSVVVDSSRGGGASASLWVLDVSAKGKRSTQAAHRIKLTLQPIGPDGHPSKVAALAEDGEEDVSSWSIEYSQGSADAMVRIVDELADVLPEIAETLACAIAIPGAKARAIARVAVGAEAGRRLRLSAIATTIGDSWSVAVAAADPHLLSAIADEILSESDTS